MSAPRATVALALVLGALAAARAGAASAQTWCVHGPRDCVGATALTIQDALDAAAAAPGRDRVEVGSSPTASERVAIAAGNQVDVVGVEQPTVGLEGTNTVSVREPSAVISGIDFIVNGTTTGPPIDLATGTLADGQIPLVGAQPTVRLGDGTLRRIEMEYATGDSVGVEAVGPGGLIEESAIFGDRGLVSGSPALVVRRTYVGGAFSQAGAAAATVTAGSTTFHDSILEPYRGRVGMVGLDVRPGAGTASVTVDGSTVTGAAAGPLTTGVRADCTSGGTATIDLVDSAVFGSGLDLERVGPGCAMALEHVRYGTRDAHGGAFTDGPGVSSGPVGPFGFFSPGFGSPLIDAGGGTPAPDALDFFGRPRLVDGDENGTTTRDIGAVEYQHAAPHALVGGPGTAIQGAEESFDAFGSGDPDGGDRLSYAWTVDGAATAADADSGGVQLTRTFTTTGVHTVGLTVTDPTGRQATDTLEVDVQADGSRPPASEPPLPARAVLPMPIAGPGGALGTAPAIAPAQLAVALATRRLGHRKTLSVGVRCYPAAGGPCRGTLVLTAGTGTGIPLTRVGSATFLVGRGRYKVIEVPVSAAARRLLRRHAKGVAVAVLVLKSSGRRWTSGQGAKVKP